jgi:hypothetical protein
MLFQFCPQAQNKHTDSKVTWQVNWCISQNSYYNTHSISFKVKLTITDIKVPGCDYYK